MIQEDFNNLIKYWAVLQKSPTGNTLVLDSLDSRVQVELSTMLKPYFSALENTTATYSFHGNIIKIKYDIVLIDDSTNS